MKSSTGEKKLFSHDVITHIIEEGSSVLDIGCGNGHLLLELKEGKGVKGRGIDIKEEMILECISRGISVFQGDIDEGLRDWNTQSYDYVVLSHTLQVLNNSILVLKEMLRVGKKAIVSFPNFGYLPTRLQLLFTGRMPVRKDLPYQWYDTPNIHLCTIKDFRILCKELNINILKEVPMRQGKRVVPLFPNLFATEVCYVLEKG